MGASTTHASKFKRTQSTIPPKLDTIISWEQADINENISISFLREPECGLIWEQICRIFDLPFDETTELVLEDD